MSKVKISIDGIAITVEKGTTVLEAAKLANIKIPTLCFLKDINEVANCRICVVEVKGKLIASCMLTAESGMEIKTNTEKVQKARKAVLELLLSNHKRECTTCVRGGNCELQRLAKEFNIREIEYEGEKSKGFVDFSSPSIVRDTEKCILCGRCISSCRSIQWVQAVNFVGRGFATRVGAAYDTSLYESNCINCGQCIMACPVGALSEKENINEVWEAINDTNKVVIVQTAPAIRVALGEEFNLEGSVTGKMVAALKRLGFNKVFDSDFGADLTIMEEGHELLERLQKNEKLPLMTSCCPGWVKFIRNNYPEMLENLSSCKSPSEMEGALIKSYFAEKMGIDASKIVVVSIMPCVAKKNEPSDVDYVLTTRELAKMIREAAIDFANLKDEVFDNPFGESTGAGVIFGTSGGVAEAAIRTVAEILQGKEIKTIEYAEIRNSDGIKEVCVEVAKGKTVSVAIVHGLSNAKKVLSLIKSGKKHFDFIEVMACPKGCINGGGQPFSTEALGKISTIDKRISAIYEEDKSSSIRKSHNNPYIKKIYEEFLGEPGSKISHDILHTHY